MWLIFMVVILNIREGRGGKRSDGNNNDKGEFTRFATKRGKHWSAAMELKGRYEGALDSEERKIISRLKKDIKKSKLDDNEKKKLLSLLDGIDTEDRWDASRSYNTAEKRMNGEISAEEASATAESLIAWRKGDITAFAKKYMEKNRESEAKPEVRQAMTKILMVGTDKGGLSAAVAVRLTIENQYSKEKTDEKIETLNEMAKVIIHI